jgi:hypothetical protein
LRLFCPICFQVLPSSKNVTVLVKQSQAGLTAGGTQMDEWGSPMELFEAMYGEETGDWHRIV